MKKIIKNILSITMVLLCFLQISCTTQKPWEYYNVVWYSTEPEIEIIEAENYNSEGYLMVGSQKILVDLLWGGTGVFEIVDSIKHSEKLPIEDIRLLSGIFDCDDLSVTLIIKKDNVYNYKYSKITLYRKDFVNS